MLSKLLQSTSQLSLSSSTRMNPLRMSMSAFARTASQNNNGLTYQSRAYIQQQKNSELDEIAKAKKQALEDSGFSVPNQEKLNEDLNEFMSRVRRVKSETNGSGAAKKPERGYLFSLGLIGMSLYIYYQWQNAPYNQLVENATISENIPANKYYHSIFTGALSFMNQGSLIVYGPAMMLSLYVCGKYMKQRHMALLFASNALVTCAVTFWYERSKSPMVTPKTHGAVTPLAFMSAAMAIAPGYCLLNLRPLPFFLIPAVFLMYECYEYQHFYVNEVCRPAHIAAMIYGLMFGLVFKKVAL